MAVDVEFQLTRIAIVLGLVLLFSIAANVILFARLFARRRRRANSECLKCGYDIRNHSGRCPECGEPVPSVPMRHVRTRCSFCGRTDHVAGRMVEGPGDVFICARCVEWSVQTLKEAHAQTQSPATPPTTSSPTTSSQSAPWTSEPDA